MLQNYGFSIADSTVNARLQPCRYIKNENVTFYHSADWLQNIVEL
jgi:hypothetical protein